MSVIGLGVDIVEIERVRLAIERQKEAFLSRIFQPSERAYCDTHREPERSYAARWAAKEAVAKALGTGFGEHLEWLDVEVCRKESGEPFIVLHGTGKNTAERMGINRWLLSLSHSESYAVASAVAISE